MLVVSYSKHFSSLLPPTLFLPLHLLLESRQIQGRIKPRPLAKTQQRERGMSATEFARASLAWKTTKETR